jgi:hypothetical protein
MNNSVINAEIISFIFEDCSWNIEHRENTDSPELKKYLYRAYPFIPYSIIKERYELCKKFKDNFCHFSTEIVTAAAAGLHQQYDFVCFDDQNLLAILSLMAYLPAWRSR